MIGGASVRHLRKTTILFTRPNIYKMQHSSSCLVLFAISLLLLKTCSALECYVCDNQEEKNGKCVKSIKTCEQDEDVCLTEIRWGSTPYWQQGALKQYYISKRCSSKDKCVRYRQSNMHLCTHIWYEDWKCSECCRGDRCNYFVFSGADNKSTRTIIPLILGLISFLLIR